MDSRTLLILIPLLGACATPAPSKAPDAGEASTGQFKDIAATPLSDLNLVRAKIPGVLKSAQKAPYDMPAEPGCTALAAQVQELDEVLGPDLDVPPTAADAGMVERGTGFIGEAAVGAARGAAEGIVPFRSWVRKLTGAERHSKEVAAAIAAGVVRRAYLKGLGQASGCQAPAAPAKQVTASPVQ